MDLEGIGIKAGNWVDSAQDYWRALMDTALNLRVPQAMELVHLHLSTCFYLERVLARIEGTYAVILKRLFYRT